MSDSVSNSLILKRDTFCEIHTEIRRVVNSREWGVLRVGEIGPNLLLLPGTLGRADIFWQQINHLSDRAQILALSYPDSGNMSDWCVDICELMIQLEFTSATVLGSSLGGYLAQYFAATNADKVERLVAANTMSDLDMLASIPPYNTDIDALPANMLMDGFRSALNNSPQENQQKADLVELLLAEISGRISVEELRARLKALQSAPDLPTQTLSISKIFTVESGDDQLIPPFVRDGVRKYLSPARSFVFEHGSHFPYVVEPEKYNEMLLEILEVG